MSLSMSLDDDDEDDFLAEKQEEQVKPVKEPTVEPVAEATRKKGKTKLVLKDKNIVEVKTPKEEELVSEKFFGENLKQTVLNLEAELEVKNTEISRLENIILTTTPVPAGEKPNVQKETVSSLLNKLYTLVKEQRTILLLEALKENYFKLKYKSFSVTEIQKMNQQISEKFLAQSLEGKVRAVINANEE